MVYDSIYRKCSGNANLWRQKVDLQLAEARGREEQELTANQHEGSFWGNASVVQLDCGDGCTTP